MKSSHRASFFQVHPLLFRILVLFLICLGVFLSFRFLLPLVFPFILAYLFMRLLLPVVFFLKSKWHFPGWLAYSFTLFLFWIGTAAVSFLLLKQLFHQGRLLAMNIPAYCRMLEQTVSHHAVSFCCTLDELFSVRAGSSMAFLTDRWGQFSTMCREFFSDHTTAFLSGCVTGAAQFCAVFLVFFISMVTLCKDLPVIHDAYNHSRFYPVFHRIALTLKKSGLAYLKTETIIFIVLWVVCSVGLTILHNPYSILVGFLISLLDAFPVLGCGMVLGPWTVVVFLRGQYAAASVLLVTLIACILLRELLESRLMGSQMGLLPFFMTAAIYIGILLFGISGIFLGPFGVILIQTLYTITLSSE